MKGFEVKFKEQNIQVGSNQENGIVSITIIYIPEREESTVFIGGQDKLKQFTWINEDIDIGDKLEVVCKEINEISPYLTESDKHNTEIDNFTLKSKLASYHELKKELEDGGHL